MAGWGDDIDEELKREEEIEVGFRLGFRGMSFLIDRIVEETREYDEKHPKDDLRFILLMIWLLSLFWLPSPIIF